jgi:hypothetical protein
VLKNTNAGSKFCLSLLSASVVLVLPQMDAIATRHVERTDKQFGSQTEKFGGIFIAHYKNVGFLSTWIIMYLCTKPRCESIWAGACFLRLFLLENFGA